MEHSSALVIEVKTTDAYRINLDKYVAYANRAKLDGLVETDPSILIVVGRQDTGDLEAQVRGSRYAWQIRLISVDSLARLMAVKDEIGERTVASKIRRVLFPCEYTRIDGIIDLVFDTQKEVEDRILDPDDDTENPAQEEASSSWNFTPREALEEKRLSLLDRFFSKFGVGHRRVSRAKHINDDRNIRVTIAVSKRYDRLDQPYWYAFNPAWLEFLQASNDGFLILGCMDKVNGYAIPIKELQPSLEKLNTTSKENRYYWHVPLGEDASGIFLNITQSGEKFTLEKYSY